MVRYVDLESKVGWLKRSVIDLYMREEGWRIRDDDYYVEVLDWAEKYVPVFHRTARLCVRPDEWGFRGGEVYDHVLDTPGENVEAGPSGDRRYVVKFDDIRSRVDAIVGPWLNLPDPVLIGQAVSAYSTVVDNLCRGTNEYITGEGTLGPNMTRIWDDLIGHVEEGGYYGPALAGGAVNAFGEYFRNLDRAVGGCGGIAGALEKSVDVQRELWGAVPSNVFAIVSTVAGACDAIARQKHPDSGVSLKDVELVLGIASDVPGPVGVVATGTEAVVTIIDSVEGGDFQQTVEIESHEGALDVLDKLLNRSFEGFGVNEMIKTFERRTCASITGNIQEVDAQRDKYDLTPGTIETVDDVIRHDEDKTGNILRRLDSVSVELGNIAGQLSGCATELDPMVCTASQVYGSGLLARDSRVGIGQNGPTDTIVALTDLLRAILTELSGEVLAGAGNFKAAMDALDRTNSQTRSSLTAAAQAYGLSDHGIDSFDFHPWTPAGRAEAVESSGHAVMDAVAGVFGLGGSSSGEGRTSPPGSPGPLDRRDAGTDAASRSPLAPRGDSWLLRPEGWAGSTDPVDEPWCAADPDDFDDGTVIIRPQRKGMP